MFLKVLSTSMLAAFVMVVVTGGVRSRVRKKMNEREQYETVRTMISMTMMTSLSGYYMARKWGMARLFVFLGFGFMPINPIELMPDLGWLLYWGMALMLYVYAALNLRAIDEEKSRQTFRLELGSHMIADGAVCIGLTVVVDGLMLIFKRDISHLYIMLNCIVLVAVTYAAVWVILGGLDGLVKRLRALGRNPEPAMT